MQSILRRTGQIFGAAGAIALMVAGAKAGGALVHFSPDYAKGVLYMTLDRADTKQFREFYVTPHSIEALKKGEPLPGGTKIIVAIYAAELDAAGNPVKGADGRFIKKNLVGLTAMEKGAGWGGEYPDNIRNGEWEYQAFNAAGAVNANANLKACFECHKPHAGNDYLFTLTQLRDAAKK